MTPEELKKKWEESLAEPEKSVDRHNSSNAKSDHAKYLQWCREIKIYGDNDNDWEFKNLALQNYASNLNISPNGYFANWVERKTGAFGKYGGNSGVHGLYVTGESTSASCTYKNHANIEINDEERQSIFNNIKDRLDEVTKLADVPATAPLSPMYCAKIAFLANPKKLLPIWKPEAIKAVADFLQVEIEPSSYKASTKIIEYLKDNKWISFEGNDESKHASQSQELAEFLLENIWDAKPITENTIFYGPPGTGKTYTITQRLEKLKGLEKAEYEIVQFHPSYTYEDFVEGWKPIVTNGQVALTLQSGSFKVFCKRAAEALKEARKNGEEPSIYYFVADEINRAELSRVFGDVLVCIEKSKRFDFDKSGALTSNSIHIQSTLGYADKEETAVLWLKNEGSSTGSARFGVPANVVFVGSMNDTDRSIDAFDLALRRRFSWERMGCDYDVIELFFAKADQQDKDIRERCMKLNSLITQEWELGDSYEIGHAYFLPEKQGARNTKSFRQIVFDSHIAPLLQEYLRSNYGENEIKKKIKEAKEKFVG